MKNASIVTTLGLAAALVLTITSRPALATPPGSTPAAKATASISQTQLLSPTTNAAWSTILSNTIHTANQKDLFVDCSLETGLLTRTVTSSHGGNKDTSTASAEVDVRVLIDGVVAYPGEIIFESRTQELSATLEGIIGSCFHIDGSGNVVLDPDCVQPEEIGLVQSTMSASSYNFIYPDCAAGVHTFAVQARIKTSTSSQQGSASAMAMVGRGSCTVEEVRMANDEVIELP
jgi:hypothetical protein